MREDVQSSSLRLSSTVPTLITKQSIESKEQGGSLSSEATGRRRLAVVRSKTDETFRLDRGMRTRENGARLAEGDERNETVADGERGLTMPQILVPGAWNAREAHTAHN